MIFRIRNSHFDLYYLYSSTRGYNLSGGQRQRLMIARALLKDAPIIIFDEPTSALDEDTARIIFDTIKNLKDKTVIVITHKKSLMEIGDYIYRINNKKISIMENRG